MKINTLAYLALLGLITANTEAAAPAVVEAEIPWYWNADDAIASEKKEQDENPFVDESDDGGAILGACFGLQSCAGFRQTDRDLIYSARDWKCNVGRTQTPTGRKDSTSALALTDFDLVCPDLLTLDQLPRPYDAMPVTFNYPVVESTLKVNGDNFIITRSDGSRTRPVCAILDPANEGNELHTVALIGHFGGREAGQWPEQIRVVGDLKLRNTDKGNNGENINAAGLKLDRSAGGTEWEMGLKQYGHGLSYESGLVMLKAWMYPITQKGETAENSCTVDFPSTTHVIKILFNGGMTIDGIHPLVPDDTRFFTILKSRARTLLWDKFLGLADLGTNTEIWKDVNELGEKLNTKQEYETDGDNYLDLCLQLAPADGDGTDIISVQIQPGAVFPPRGTGPNIQHMVKVDHIAADGPYPHNLQMVPFSEKVYDAYVEYILSYVSIAGPAGLGIILVPLIGILGGTGLMFLQSYVPSV